MMREQEPGAEDNHSAIRVAHLTRAIFRQHGYGGLERSASALTSHLLRRGVAVMLFTQAWRGVRDHGPGIGDQTVDQELRITHYALADLQVVTIPYSVL